jgi:hypothetical protein
VDPADCLLTAVAEEDIFPSDNDDHADNDDHDHDHDHDHAHDHDDGDDDGLRSSGFPGFL